MSAARHAYSPTVAVAHERPQKPDVPLTFFGIALRTTFGIALSAVATWFVLLPAIHEKPPTLQTCKVVLLADGTTRCDNGDTLANVVNEQP